MDLNYDIIIIGGSLGGVAAAIRGGSMGATVCLIEATDWLGGQYTAQGVCTPDENHLTQSVGSTQAYRAFQHNVRAYYRSNFKLSAAGAKQPALNPGGSYPGFSTEPRVGHTVLLQTLTDLTNVHVRLSTTIATVEMNGDTVTAITAATGGTVTRYTASWFLDATDLGELLPLCGKRDEDWLLGAESQEQTGEPSAPLEVHPEWVQPITFPIALERRPAGENHTIPEPEDYALIKAIQNYSIKDGCIGALFYSGLHPGGDCKDSHGRPYVDDMWGYRKFIDASNFSDPHYPCDLSMMNCNANDYKEGGTIPSGDPDHDAVVLHRARLVSLGYLYWLQTECPRDEDPMKKGYPELKPRGDLFDTDSGVSAQAYIRESRRIKALKTIVEQDISADYNKGARAKLFADTCGIGWYGMDVHALKAIGMDEKFIDTKPFQIPASALVPIRWTNLLPACKNLGVTHLTNGAYRLHPVEWAIGEAAGALAAFCLRQGKSAKEVVQTPGVMKSYQHALLEQGAPLFWWADVMDTDPIYNAVQLLGAAGIVSGDEKMNFLPNNLLTEADKQVIEENTGRSLSWPSKTMTRRQAAPWLVQELGL